MIDDGEIVMTLSSETRTHFCIRQSKVKKDSNRMDVVRLHDLLLLLIPVLREVQLLGYNLFLSLACL